MKNKIKTPLDLAKAIERSHGEAMWRYNWVQPATESEPKKYNWEFPDKTSAEIKDGWKSKSGKYTFPGRGYPTLKDVPSWMKKDEDQNPIDFSKCYRGISMYIKFVKDLYVVDFDGGDDYCRSVDEETGLVVNPFFKFCMDSETIYIRTKKGYHFYFYIPGTPSFTCSTKLQGEEAFGDVDILGRKMPSCFNVVEAEHHDVINGEKGIDSVKSIPWETMKDYLNVKRMLGQDKKNNDRLTKKEKNETQAILGGNDEVELPLDKFKGYLARLRKEDHRTQMDKKSRWNYEDFLDIGIICKNNFEDDSLGFKVWMDWVMEDPDMACEGHDHQRRDLKYLMEKWESFKDAEHPKTWKSLRWMANQDDPKKNVFQEIYDASGEDGVVDYLNTQICMNISTGGEIIHVNPEETKVYNALPNIFPTEKCAKIYSKYSIWVEGAKGMKKVNPFNMWMTHPAQRQVNRIVFDPTPTAPKDVFNMFDGFDIGEKDVADLTLEEANERCHHLMQHLWHIWAQRDQATFDYILNWFAFVLQKPWIKIGVVLAVQSKEGAGKGIVLDYMRQILGGRLYAQINSIDQLIGNHNSILEGRLLINGDEVLWGGNNKDGNALKGVITETELYIHEKYRARYRINNTTAICLSSNELWMLSSREGDRRCVAVKLDDTWAGRQKTAEHKAYFCNISGTDHFGIARDKCEGFAKILFERDLTNFNPKDAPITELLTDQMERNYSPVQKFWKGILNRGNFQIEDKFKKKTRVETPVQTEFGVKKEISYLDYDNAQLDWGNVSPDFGNGIKEFHWVYENTNRPIKASLFYPSPRYNSRSASLQKNWRNFLAEMEKRGIWVEDEADYDLIPIPECFLKVNYLMSGGTEERWVEDKENVKHLPKSQTTYQWTSDTENHSQKRLKPISSYLPADGVENRGDHAEMCGLRVEHLQKPNDADPVYGSRPRMIRKTNIGGDTGYPNWHYDQHETICWHFEDLDNSWYKKIDTMNKASHLYEMDTDNHHNDCDWSCPPSNYIRSCVDCITPVKVEVDGWRGEKRMAYPDDFSSCEIDEGVIKSYLEKWGNGVNADNFGDDLITREWYDDDGNKLFYCSRKKRINRWVYDKGWVFSRYKESEGVGYGQDNVDDSAFWKEISDMLGGDKSKKMGGEYKNVRINLPNGSRATMWQFVPLAKAREKFEQWAQRKVKWEDGEEEDIDDMPQGWF